MVRICVAIIAVVWVWKKKKGVCILVLSLNEVNLVFGRVRHHCNVEWQLFNECSFRWKKWTEFALKSINFLILMQNNRSALKERTFLVFFICISNLKPVKPKVSVADRISRYFSRKLGITWILIDNKIWY